MLTFRRAESLGFTLLGERARWVLCREWFDHGVASVDASNQGALTEVARAELLQA